MKLAMSHHSMLLSSCLVTQQRRMQYAPSRSLTRTPYSRIPGHSVDKTPYTVSPSSTLHYTCSSLPSCHLLPDIANKLQPYDTPLPIRSVPRSRLGSMSFPRSRSLPNPKRCECWLRAFTSCQCGLLLLLGRCRNGRSHAAGRVC